MTALVGHFATKSTVCNSTAVHHRAGKLPAGEGSAIPYLAAESTAADGCRILHRAFKCTAGDLGRAVVLVAALDPHGAAFLMRRAAAYRYFIPNGKAANAENTAAGVYIICFVLERAAIPYGCRTGEDCRAEIADTASTGVIIRRLCHAAGNGAGGHLKPAAIFHMNTAALARRTTHDIAAPHKERAAGRHINTAAVFAVAAGDGAALYHLCAGSVLLPQTGGFRHAELIDRIGLAVHQREDRAAFHPDNAAAAF